MPPLDVPLWVTQLVLVGYVLLVVFAVVLERRRPTSTLVWIFALVFVPLVGLLAYVFIGRRRVRRRVRRRRRREVNPTDAEAEVAHLSRPPAELPPPLDGLVRLALSSAAAPLRRCDTAELIPNPAEAFAAIEDAISRATERIHLEFYIWRDDDAGRRLVERLTERAAAGVKVRLLFDDLGSLGTSRAHFESLVAAGGQVRAWGQLRIRLRLARSRLNFRNHRKLVTIDGREGFTGGLNVGDEYRGQRTNGTVWNDLLVHMTGDAVVGLDAIFAEDWLATTGELLEFDGARGEDPSRGAEGPMVQIIASGPEHAVASAIAAQFVAAISVAHDRCWITTPYFIPDDALALVLRTAAMRGVDVRILVPTPRENDSRLVGLASRSYYDDLLDAGVRIFEWNAGMLHAKSMVIDDCVAAVGSANFDVRSLYINYEVTAMFYDATMARALAAVFEQDLGGAHEVTFETRASLGVVDRLGESFARVLSPLM